MTGSIYSFSSLYSMTQNVFKENMKTQLRRQTTIRNSKDIYVWLNEIEELFFFLLNTTNTLIHTHPVTLFQ